MAHEAKNAGEGGKMTSLLFVHMSVGQHTFLQTEKKVKAKESKQSTTKKKDEKKQKKAEKVTGIVCLCWIPSAVSNFETFQEVKVVEKPKKKRRLSQPAATSADATVPDQLGDLANWSDSEQS